MSSYLMRCHGNKARLGAGGLEAVGMVLPPFSCVGVGLMKGTGKIGSAKPLKIVRGGGTGPKVMKGGTKKGMTFAAKGVKAGEGNRF